MRVMVLVKASADSEAGVLPTSELIEQVGRYNEQLLEAGVMLAGEGLHPSSQAQRLTFAADGSSTVVDGPFGLTDLVSGYWLWQVDTMDEALEWLERAPLRNTEVELRRVFEMADFAAVITDDQAAAETAMREQLGTAG